jgi:hypothetical protein
MATFAFAHSIPEEANQQISEFILSGQEIQWVAFRPGVSNSFTIVTNVTFFNRNIPQECHDQMVAFKNAGQKILCVAFAPGSGARFSIITDQTFFNRNIAQECHDQMVAFKNAGQKVLCVAFPVEGGNRFSIVTDQTFFNRNIPQECHDQMVAFRKAGQKIRCVAFGPQGGNQFSILTDETFFNRNIPQDCHDKMVLALDCVGAPKVVAFDGAGAGWAVLAAVRLQLAPPTKLLQITGSATVSSGDLTRLQFNPTAKVTNLTDSPVQITRAYPFLTARGGWAFDLTQPGQILDNFWGYGPSVPAGAGVSLNGGSWGFTAPVTHFLYRLEARNAANNTQNSFVQLPIAKAGFPTPPSLDADLPVMISLQEPVDAFPLDDGKNQVTLLGQLVNGSSHPVTLKYWHVTIEKGADVIYSKDLTSTFVVVNHPAGVIPFLYGIPLPSSFDNGRLTIDAIVEVNGKCKRIQRQASMARVYQSGLMAPVEGRWNWGNGPGQLDFQPHYGAPEQRYAYDIGILENGSTFSGDPNKNDSFFCWDKPIYAMADGIVDYVKADVPDNFGRTFNNANSARQNNLIVIKHSNNRYSVYAHARHGSAQVKAGDHVKAGDLIAHVGNAGTSSEPHLHFDLREYDAYGRARAIPMTFVNVARLDGAPTQGVPHGSRQYLCAAGTALAKPPSITELAAAPTVPVPFRCGLVHRFALQQAATR